MVEVSETNDYFCTKCKKYSIQENWQEEGMITKCPLCKYKFNLIYELVPVGRGISI